MSKMKLAVRRSRWKQITAIILLLCSCSPPKNPPAATNQFPNWPSQFDNFRFHWYAAPGIDLTGAPAVAIRAYVESYQLAKLAHTDDVLYPGFLRATPENLKQERGIPIELTQIRPLQFRPDPGIEWPRTDIFGYQPSYLLSLAKGYNGYSAIVCEGHYATYQGIETIPGKFRSIITSPATGSPPYGDRQSVYVWRIELTDKKAPDGPQAPMTLDPMQGPLPAPTGDVFDQWFITAASFHLWGPSGDGVGVATPELQQQCFDSMPDDAATRKAMYTGFHDAPPPHGNAVPGWPD